MFHRIISPIKTNSFFLFGGRGTGKSTFLKEFLAAENPLWIDLLDPLQEDEIARDPAWLRKRIGSEKKAPAWVVIDEVQKVPKLLDVVHQLIESTKIKFA